MKFSRMINLCSMVLCVSSYVWAQDPTVAAADIYKKVFENDRVRVLHVNFKSGGLIPSHSHPDHVSYAMNACTITVTTKGEKPQTVPVKEGDVIWFDALTHSGQNTGKTDCEIVIVELKEPKPAK